MGKFQNKYRILSAGWQNWDYRNAAAYFITICTKDRLCYFGDIQNEEMQLSDIGKLVEKYWMEIPDHFKNVHLGEFVVMPNHIHGILILVDGIGGDGVVADGFTDQTESENDGQTNPTSQSMSDISPKSGSVSTIIRSYKSVCTKYANIHNQDLNFGWQSRFHDHVIRNETEYQRIANYIANNPRNWKNDKFYLSP